MAIPWRPWLTAKELLTGPDDSFPLIVDGPESVVAVTPPREIPTRVRELVRRHARRR